MSTAVYADEQHGSMTGLLKLSGDYVLLDTMRSLKKHVDDFYDAVACPVRQYLRTAPDHAPL